MASVRLREVWKKYGKVEAVKGISLECRDGEFLALLGPSGCGKTSTLRMIAGLETITAGEILIGDRIVNRLRPRERNVAMAFETYALYPPLNVFENIAFPLRARGMREKEIRGKVEKIAAILEIEDILTRLPAELSGGQKQRVGLGRALVRDPAVFLLDEPISHLDARQRARMRTHLKRLHMELGTTMIYVTHDQQEAMAMADRIAVMNLGELKQLGTPDEIYNRPACEFVASFVGEPTMNFIRAGLVRQGDRLTVSAGGVALCTVDAAAWRGGVPVSREVRLGVRPHDVLVADSPGEQCRVPAKLSLREGLGDYAVLTLDFHDQPLQAVVGPDFAAEIGQELWVGFAPNKVHLFPPSA